MAGNMTIHHSIDSPLRRERFSILAKAMKDVPEVLAIAQLSNAGRMTPENINPRPISSSEVPCLSSINKMGAGYGKPRALTVDEIKNKVIRDHVYAAKYCRKAGFNGIQLHSAHDEFLKYFQY